MGLYKEGRTCALVDMRAHGRAQVNNVQRARAAIDATVAVDESSVLPRHGLVRHHYLRRLARAAEEVKRAPIDIERLDESAGFHELERHRTRRHSRPGRRVPKGWRASRRCRLPVDGYGQPVAGRAKRDHRAAMKQDGLHRWHWLPIDSAACR